jgi:hypothetical protein
MKTPVLILVAVAFVVYICVPWSQALAEVPADRAEIECKKRAMTDYVRKSIAILKSQGASVPSVEATLAERRLKEEYCERMTACSFPDSHSSDHAVAFSRCVTVIEGAP